MRAGLLFAVFLSLFLPSAAEAAEAPALLVAVDAPYPPFAVVEANGSLSGFDVDMANALCRQIQRRCEIKAVPFDSIIPLLEAGELDMAVAGMGATDERKKRVNFTERYFRSHSIFIEKAGVHAAPTPEALAGKKIAAQKGTLQEMHLTAHYKNSLLVTADNFEGLFAMLRSGEADAVLVDGLPGYEYLKAPEGAGLETIGDPVYSNVVLDSSCIAVSKKHPELVPLLNGAIQAIRKSGEYGKINRKYFDFNVY